MTVGEAMKKAIAEDNAIMAGRVSDQLRFNHGWSYDMVYELAKKTAGISAADFDDLMYRADMES
jgi:hypothetical protein